MKKILLGTTSFVGAVALANVALADTPKITVGGFADFQGGYVSEDLDAGLRNHGFRSDTEVSFKVDGKTDAGLGYGAEIWLEADVTSDADNQGLNSSKTFVYLDGMWGRVELGSNIGADATMKVDASSIARATGGIDGDWYYFATAPAAQFIATPDLPINYGAGAFGDESSENLNKVTYYTPRWSGFQAGVSYAVDSDDRGQTVSRADNTIGQAEDIITAGVNWEGKFDQFGLTLAATGEIGDAENSATEDLRAWNAGAKVTFMGFSVAGSYGDLSDSLQLATTDADSSYWTAGAAYEFGPFGVSVSYIDSEVETAAGDNEFDNLVIGADYKLAPGLTPYAEVSFFDANAGAAGVADNDGTVVLLGTQLNF